MTKRFLVLFLIVAFSSVTAKASTSVESVGMTVSDMDRAVGFYSALTFQKVSDVEVVGDEFEHLEGVFGARMRIVRMQLSPAVPPPMIRWRAGITPPPRPPG